MFLRSDDESHAALTGAVAAVTAEVNRWAREGAWSGIDGDELAAAVEATRTGIDDFRLDDASLGLYHFFWGELCDWYLELSKPIFAEGGAPAEETRNVLAHVLESALRLLHPFIPFITEELWHKVPRPEGVPLSLALASYPGAEAATRDLEVEKDMNALMAVISAARSVRSEHDVHPGAAIPLTLRTGDARLEAVLRAESRSIRFLAKTAGDPTIEAVGAARPPGAVMTIAADTEVLVSLKGLVEGAKEGARVEREIKKVEKDIAALEKEVSDLLKAHFGLRMQKATQQLQNHTQLGRTRREIARVKTIIAEAESAGVLAANIHPPVAMWRVRSAT